MTPTPAKVKILFIEASPPDHSRLDTGTERAHAEDALWASLNPEVFEVLGRSAAHPHELESYLRRRQPRVIHFSGHGNHWGDLILSASDGATSHPLRGEDFAEKLCRYAEHAPQVVRLVVLAGCYTEHAAQLASACVDCAIGMADEVEDVAMVDVFTPTLYRALGDGCSVAAAVKEAEQALRTHQPRQYTREADAVRLYTRQGVEGAKWKLTGLAAPAPALSQVHKKYLDALFQQRWARVKMNLFDSKSVQEVDLLEIYAPLPVDFAISLELDKQEDLKEWWCTGCRSEREGREELEPWERVLAEQADRRALTEAVQEHKLRARSWADLQADERALQPLRDTAHRWARQQRSEARERPAFFGERGTLRWQAEAEHAVLVQRRFVLVGDAGSGKSTFLRHLALSWAARLLCEAGETRTKSGARLDIETDWPGPTFIPVYIELRPLAETFPALPPGDDSPEMPDLETFEAYLGGQLAAMKCETFCDDLMSMLAAGRAAILLDGLDEVSDADDHRRRMQVQAFVIALQKAFDQAPIIVTARPYAYRLDNPIDPERWELPGFGYSALIPLEPKRQEALAHRLFACLPSGDDRRADMFVAALRGVPRDLPGNPLLLMLLAAISVRRPVGESHALPKTRGELYHRALTLLLEDWVKEHNERLKKSGEFSKLLGGLNGDDLRLALQLVARRAQERSTQPNQAVIIQRNDFYAALDDIGKGETTPSVVKHLRWAAGMLLDLVEQTPGAIASPEPGRFRFLHLSFQEYLAACDMLYRPGTPNARPRKGAGRGALWDERPFPETLVAQVLQKPRLWANVLRLAVDELLARGRLVDAWELLARCCRPDQEDGGADLGMVLALQVALDANFFSVLPFWEVQSYYRTLRDAAQKALKDYPRDDHPGLSPAQCDIAGRLLGDGPCPGHDLRPGVGVRNGLPDIAWVEIPDDGEFIYQEAERRTERTFWIAKYPITYAQFQAFVNAADGFRNPVWCEKPTRLAAPAGQRDAPGEQAFPYWNHPRERVSWYDAVAFCRWLTAQVKTKVEAKVDGWEALLPKALIGTLDWQITLPTEWQWEKAARGRDGRQYPWGPKYKEGYANIDERYGNAGSHYLQKTSAVGMYPHEKPQDSPYGVADLSGNVWEWCVTKYDKPDDPQPEQGSESRVLRGRSWDDLAERAAASRRYWGSPLARVSNIGFRVVVAGGVPFSSAL